MQLLDRLILNTGLNNRSLCGDHLQLVYTFTAKLQHLPDNEVCLQVINLLIKRLYLGGAALVSKFSVSLDTSMFLRAFALILWIRTGRQDFLAVCHVRGSTWTTRYFGRSTLGTINSYRS
jgi:hypothetical protein